VRSQQWCVLPAVAQTLLQGPQSLWRRRCW